MSSIFNTKVSVGHSKRSKKVQPDKLGRVRFENFSVHTGDKVKKDGAYYTAALMKGDVRANLQIAHVELLVIDIDEVTPKEIKHTIRLIEESGLECIRHTTFSHTPEKPKWRFIFKASRPLSLREHACIVPQLATDMAIGSFDPVSKQAAMPMFYPMVHESRLGTEEYDYTQGLPVKVEPYLMAMINEETLDEYESPRGRYDPMPIPGALNEANWLEAVLTAYPASACPGYDTWTEVGMALWHQTDGRVYDVWLAWSRLNPEMHAREISEYDMEHKKWPSFKNPPPGQELVTLRKIVNRKNGANRSILALAYRHLLGRITDPADLARVLTDIKDEHFLHGTDRNVIGRAYKEASKRISGDILTMGEAMMCVSRDSGVGGTKEFFHNRYLFNEGESQYYDIHSKCPVPITSINFMYGSHMPPSNSGERKITHKVLSNESNGYVKPRVMHGYAYEVQGEPVVIRDGKYYLNQFIPDSWPDAEDSFDENDDLDIRIRTMVFRHFTLLCNGDDTLKRMLLQHLAHLRLRPNKRLHFAYAVSSYFHGVGKTTLRHLYETVLGAEQVNVLAATNIAEDFNAYVSAPKLMSFIEEFEFDTRREQNKAIKKMKDLITSDSISVRRMRTDPIRTETYTAYALFSNDEYVLGHESTGRRWVPIIVDAANEDQCSVILGMPHEKFYTEYYQLMEDHPDRFVAFFESISLEGFQTERPPMTKQKAVFIENVPAMRVLRIIQDIIESEVSLDVTDDYACGFSVLKLVRNHVEFHDSVDADELDGQSNRQLRTLIVRALKSAGYKQLANTQERVRLPFVESERVRIDDVWTKGVADLEGPLAVRRLRKVMRNTEKRRRLKMEEGKILRMDRKPWEGL